MDEGCESNCQCTEHMESLGVDTSHVAVLARAAAALGTTLRAVIELHGCEGNRALFTSSDLLDIELNFADPDCKVRPYAPGEDLRDALEPVEGRPHDPETLRRFAGYRPQVPEASTRLDLGRRDGTLVAVAEDVVDGAAIVSDDESLLKWIAVSAEDSVVDARPIPSISLLGSMHKCGAVSEDFLVTALDEERQHHESRNVPAWIMSIKLARIRAETNRLARRTSDRS